MVTMIVTRVWIQPLHSKVAAKLIELGLEELTIRPYPEGAEYKLTSPS